MGHVLREQRFSTEQQPVGAVRERVPFAQSKENFRQHKFGHSFGLPYRDFNSESRLSESSVQAARPKSSDSDELVKHVSDLPDFLHQAQKGKSIQERALNYGVLEWKRLDKWKYTERMPGKSSKITSSSNSSVYSASGPPKLSPILRKQSPHNHNPSSLYSDKQGTPHGSCFSSPQRQAFPPQEVRCTGNHKEEKYVRPVKFNGNERCNQRFQAARLSTTCRQQDQFVQRVQLYDRICSRANVDNRKLKDSETEKIPGKEVLSSEQGKQKFYLAPSLNSNKGKSEMRYDDKVKCTAEFGPVDAQSYVFISNHLPKYCGSKNSPLVDSRTSFGGRFSDAVGNTFSDFFPGDIRHSCPLPSGANFLGEPTMDAHYPATSHPVDLDIQTDVSPHASSVTSIVSEGKCPMSPRKTARAPSSGKTTDNAHAGIAKQPIVQGRACSPTRRFSFSLGKLSRSNSHKESPAAPQLSSPCANVKSGQVRPEVPSTMASIEKDKEDAASKRQSSPLRRLLNSLPIYKGSQSGEIGRLSNGSSRSMDGKTTNIKELPPDRTPEASFVQALLQLTLKNELPFFKLAIDSSEDMLAAALKRFPTSGKGDPCMIYTFYSIHETKKKGMTWMSPGSRSKNCSLDYNIVGQMKISKANLARVKDGDYGECDATQCVLYGVDAGQVDKEIAAIILKSTVRKLNVEELCDKRLLYREMKTPQSVSAATFHTRKNKLNGTVVILPGGVHGTPNRGAPSSLITRWISGGSCDCGGWDVGCKLRILADCNKSCSIPQASVSTSDVDRVNLFVQGNDKKSKPAFRLEPLSNGLYSIELDASISLLQAFATCVAYVTCGKFPEILDTKGQPGAKISAETCIRFDDRTKPTMSHVQVAGKYVTCPPLSPAGRI